MERRDRRRVGVAACVDECGDHDAGGAQIEGDVDATIVGDHDHRPTSRLDAIEPMQALRRAAEHHAGQVVVLEHHRILDDAARHDDLTRPQRHEPVLLEHPQQAVLVEPERRRVTEDANAIVGTDLEGEIADDLPAGAAVVQGARVGSPAAAELGLVVDQRHARPGPCRLQRRRHPGDATADDGDVGEQMGALVVARRLVGKADAPESGAATEHALVGGPQAARVNEGLVIEPDGKQEIHLVEHGQRVPLQGRPGVLPHDTLPLAQRLRAGADTRNAIDVDQAVRAVPATAEEPSRAVVLEAAAEDSHARGVERGRHRVAGQAHVCAAVERERHRSRAIDPLRGVSGEPAHARGSEGGPGQNVSATSFDRVSRPARNQRRQPAR